MIFSFQHPVFFLDIQASDRGNPPRKTVTTVLIRVLDVNDNQPVMERSFYEVSVNENASIGTALLQLTAWDYDAGTLPCARQGSGTYGPQ